MKLKTHKTIAKRIRVTKSGKLLKRKAGQDHFNARESGNVTRAKRRDVAVARQYVKNLLSLIPNK